MRAWAVVSGVAMVTLLVIESGLACSNARGVWFHYHDRPGVERARFLAGELGVLRAVVRRGLSLCRLSLFDRASAIGSDPRAYRGLLERGRVVRSRRHGRVGAGDLTGPSRDDHPRRKHPLSLLPELQSRCVRDSDSDARRSKGTLRRRIAHGASLARSAAPGFRELC